MTVFDARTHDPEYYYTLLSNRTSLSGTHRDNIRTLNGTGRWQDLNCLALGSIVGVRVSVQHYMRFVPCDRHDNGVRDSSGLELTREIVP
jgi:hypothetical protein